VPRGGTEVAGDPFTAALAGHSLSKRDWNGMKLFVTYLKKHRLPQAAESVALPSWREWQAEISGSWLEEKWE
jgi:hypothetical protein